MRKLVSKHVYFGGDRLPPIIRFIAIIVAFLLLLRVLFIVFAG